MEKEIIEGKFKIANFMGHNYESISNPVFKVNLYDLHDYDDSWNKLMPVYYKFRDLQDITMEMYEAHHDWCGNIAQAISLSESKTPTEAFSSLVEAIQWYTQSK